MSAGPGADRRRAAWERLQGLELYLKVAARLLGELERRGLGASPEAAALSAARRQVRHRARALSRTADGPTPPPPSHGGARRALTFWRRPWR